MNDKKNFIIAIEDKGYPYKFFGAMTCFCSCFLVFFIYSHADTLGCLLALGFVLFCLLLTLLLKPRKVKIFADDRNIQVHKRRVISIQYNEGDILHYKMPTTLVGLCSNFNRGGDICLIQKGEECLIFRNIENEDECEKVYAFLSKEVRCVIMPMPYKKCVPPNI